MSTVYLKKNALDADWRITWQRGKGACGRVDVRMRDERDELGTYWHNPHKRCWQLVQETERQGLVSDIQEAERKVFSAG